MTRRVYWGLAILTILVVTATVWVVLHNTAEIEEMKRESADLLPQSDDPSLPHTSELGEGSPDYQPPPLGETYDTGYWEGNTWHQKPAPKPKKKWFWEREMTLKEFHLHDPTDAFIETIIQNQPYSEAALFARMHYLPCSIEDLKAALKYHPDSPALHLYIAEGMPSAGGEGKSGMFHKYSPEETVAFGEKALRLLKNSTENPDVYYSVCSSTLEGAHQALGIAYQYLGDYDAALYHLKQGQRLYEPMEGDLLWYGEDGTAEALGAAVYSANIAAIEAGTPIHKPKPKPTPQVFSLEGDVPLSPSSYTPEDMPIPPLFDLPGPVQRSDASTPPENALSVRERRAREVAEQAHAAFMREVQDPHRQQQAFDDFLRRMEAAANQKSSQVADTFLMREMAKQLRGNKTALTSQELLRAFSAVRQRQTQGKRQLEKIDSEREREMARQQRSQSVPPHPNNPPE